MMISSFRKTVTGWRKGAGAYEQGVWVEGTLEEFSFTASVQPLNPREMELLPEGRRIKQAYKLFTDTQLLTAGGEVNADLVSINGETCEVFSVAPYQSEVISHYKIIAVLYDD